MLGTSSFVDASAVSGGYGRTVVQTPQSAKWMPGVSLVDADAAIASPSKQGYFEYIKSSSADRVKDSFPSSLYVYVRVVSGFLQHCGADPYQYLHLHIIH
jgi:hypothetical protein